MIETERTFGTTRISCDAEYCKSQDFVHDGFDGYYDVKEACKEAREFGWIIKKIDDEWNHYCDQDCYEKDIGGAKL